MTHVIYLLLGSNLGDRLANLRAAITSLSAKIQPIAQSSVYETEPWGYSEQPAFLNLVLKGDTELSPLDLLSFLKETEVTMGRVETFRFGPRLIDLDILFYDDLILESPKLTIPHPRITERAFVLVPLTDIAPGMVHPGLGITIQQLKFLVDTSNIKQYPSAIT